MGYYRTFNAQEIFESMNKNGQIKNQNYKT